MELWKKQVIEAAFARCANCGGDDHVRARQIIPDSAGGKLIPTNGVALCRPCEMAMEAAMDVSKTTGKRPFNFWVSASIFDKMQHRNGFRSMSSLVRHLVYVYIADPDRYHDLGLYQAGEGNPREVKVNVWVDSDLFDAFKGACEPMTATEAVTSLITMYLSDADQQVEN